MFTVKAKRKPLIAVMLISAALLIAALFFGLFGSAVAAADDGNIGRTYYYKELKNSALAQKFYGVIKEMSENGQLDDGKYEYDLSSVLTEKEIAAYVDNGSPKIPVAFGAARDAFYMDNPDLFYIDVYKLYLSAGMQNGKYVAFVGTGNADNYFVDYTVKSAAEAEQAKAKYETEISKAVDSAKLNNADVVTQIKNVNKYLINNAEYDYGAYSDALNGNVTYNGYVNTAYGALVEGKAMCGGFSRAFKAIMDRLDIPCVLISGTGYSGASAAVEGTTEKLDAGFLAHMWNAVEVDGMWYGVDVTWNETSGNAEKYMLVGDDYMSEGHIPDGVISSSGFELKYPAIRPLDYGVDTDKNGFTFKDSGSIGDKEFGYYNLPSDKDNYYLNLGVSYNGKNAKQLEEEGKYFAFRSDLQSMWFGFEAWVEFASANVDMSSAHIDEYNVFSLNWSQAKIQFAVFDFAPNMDVTQFGQKYRIAYDPDTLTPDHIIAISSVYNNKAYGGYMPAPYIKKMTPDEKGSIRSFEPLKVTIEYSEKLVYVDDIDKTVEISITGKSSDLGEKAKTKDVVWNESTNTLTFTLIPSQYFAHFDDTYNMIPTNLVGEKSGKVPEPAYLSFKRKQVVCPKVFNDGRLYMQVFGRPQFVSASDESLNEFAGPDGKPIVGDQRSQLMLVVNEPSKAESDQMKDMALDPANKTGLTSAQDIKSSSTYEIDLLMCGLVQKVPDGSFMQVGFGFPEGYGPESAGVTFTVYHYTRNPDGTVKSVETVPCVITEYGIMATVKSFSPFMICAIDEDKAPKYKSLYASVNGVGGKINDDAIRTFDNGDEFSYTFTPDEGYKVDKVVLNGVEQQLVGNTLKVGYAMLAGDSKRNSNVLEVTFVAERVATYRESNDLDIKPLSNIVVRESDMIKATAHATPRAPKEEGSVVGIAVGVTIAIAVVLIGGCLAFYFVMRKKKATAVAGAPSQSAKKTASETRSAKTVENKKPESAANRTTAQNKTVTPNARNVQNTQTPQNGRVAPTRTTAQPRPTSQNRPSANGNGAHRTPPNRSVTPNGRSSERTNGNKPTDRK